MKWLKKIFGTKEKPKDETPLLPIKDEEQPLSVPIEEKIVIENNPVLIKNFESIEVEEPIAPTLERQDDVIGSNVDEVKNEPQEFEWKDEPTNKEYIFKKGKIKEVKPKRKYKKKGNPDDKSDWPKGNNFSL